MSGALALRDVESPFDVDRIEAIAARLDLRHPNREALESIAFEVAQHFEIDREPPPFEGVVDIATGVGKTYVRRRVGRPHAGTSDRSPPVAGTLRRRSPPPSRTGSSARLATSVTSS